MQLARLSLLLLTIFFFGGASEIFAQEKVAKAKITRQPSSVTVQFGQSATFTVQHNSVAPVTYQWRRNKRPLPDADEASYTIHTVFADDAGKYDVVITNSRGATSSKAATLTVNLAPASLPLDAILYGEFVARIRGQNIEADGAYIITGPNSLIDPEEPSDTHTYSYARQPKNRAKLVINSRFFDPDLGDFVTSREDHSLVFTGVSPGGELIANSTVKGTFTPPRGYKPSKLKFTARGTLSIEGAELYNFVPFSGGSMGGSVSVIGGSLTIGNGNNTQQGGGHTPGENTGSLILDSESSWQLQELDNTFILQAIGP